MNRKLRHGELSDFVVIIFIVSPVRQKKKKRYGDAVVRKITRVKNDKKIRFRAFSRRSVVGRETVRYANRTVKTAGRPKSDLFRFIIYTHTPIVIIHLLAINLTLHRTFRNKKTKKTSGPFIKPLIVSHFYKLCSYIFVIHFSYNWTFSKKKKTYPVTTDYIDEYKLQMVIDGSLRLFRN